MFSELTDASFSEAIKVIWPVNICGSTNCPNYPALFFHGTVLISHVPVAFFLEHDSGPTLQKNRVAGCTVHIDSGARESSMSTIENFPD